MVTAVAVGGGGDAAAAAAAALSRACLRSSRSTASLAA
jgi:hypothetical protein